MTAAATRITTGLQRLPAGGKVAGLTVIGTALFFIQSIFILLAISSASTAILICIENGVRALRSALLWPVVLAGAVMAAHVLLTPETGMQTGGVVALRLFALLVLARLVMATTRVSDMAEAVTRALTPLEPLGVNPRRVATLFAICIRFIPVLGRLVRQTRDAHLVRGGGRAGLRVVLPAMVRTIRFALMTGDALEARGWRASQRELRA